MLAKALSGVVFKQGTVGAELCVQAGKLGFELCQVPLQIGKPPFGERPGLEFGEFLAGRKLQGGGFLAILLTGFLEQLEALALCGGCAEPLVHQRGLAALAAGAARETLRHRLLQSP